MALDDDVDKLASIPAFAALEPAALRLIAFSAETRFLRAGDVLFRRDDPSNGGYLLLSGSIALDASEAGEGSARILRSPAFIGELALVTQTVRPATAIAREASSVLRISRQLFHRVLHESPASAERLRRIFAENLLGLVGELGSVRQALLRTDEAADAQVAGKIIREDHNDR